MQMKREERTDIETNAIQLIITFVCAESTTNLNQSLFSTILIVYSIFK